MATAEYTLVNAPYFLQVATGTPLYYSAEDFREYTGATQRRTGILGAADFRIVQALDIGWTIQVLPGYANLNNAVGGGGPGQNLGGIYTAYQPANIPEIPLPMRPPGTGTRTHKVFLAVFNPLIVGSATIAKIIVTEDVGSGAPAPVGTAGYLQLATLTMTAGQSNLQDKDIKNIAQHGGSAGESFDLETNGNLAAGYIGIGLTGAPENLRARYDNGIVRFSGAIRKEGGAAFPSGMTDLTIGKMPPEYVPRTTRYATGVCATSSTGTTGTMTWRFAVLAVSGNMVAKIPSTQTPYSLYFDGITYDLD